VAGLAGSETEREELVTGLTLWADAGTNMRRLFIRLACDADWWMRYPVLKRGIRHELTIAQALEVTE
jgi:hypothetical protein